METFLASYRHGARKYARLLDEALQIAKQMWSGDESPYHGKHNQLERPLCSPQLRSKPHPPIMVEGGGGKKTLRLVAQYADACNALDEQFGKSHG